MNHADFWANLDPYPWLDQLAAKVKEYDTIILSHAVNPDCMVGKIQWLRKYLPWLADDAIFTKDKHLLAKANRCLLDDSEVNCSAFIQNGGDAMLFPQRWNAFWELADSPLERLPWPQIVRPNIIGVTYEM